MSKTVLRLGRAAESSGRRTGVADAQDCAASPRPGGYLTCTKVGVLAELGPLDDTVSPSAQVPGGT